MDHAPDVYRVLQVDPGAEPAVVQAAYRALARRYHPDGDMPDPARMAAINRAFATIRTPELRAAYDRTRLHGGLRALGPGPMPRPAGSGIIDFGRYAGYSVTDLAKHDPDYLRWLSRHSSGLRYRELIAAVLPGEPDLSRRASSVG